MFVVIVVVVFCFGMVIFVVVNIVFDVDDIFIY